MSSPTHRANILDPAMRQVGVGVVSSGGYLWVTEVFRNPTGSGGTVAPRPARHTSSPATTRSAPRPASRSQVRVDPVRAALALLQARAARLPASADPVGQAVGWSSTMRALVPGG